MYTSKFKVVKFHIFKLSKVNKYAMGSNDRLQHLQTTSFVLLILFQKFFKNDHVMLVRHHLVVVVLFLW